MNPHVVYVLGLGHSGSTILQYLLCNHDAVLGLGEVRHMAAGMGWSESTEDCSCGTPVSSCAVWKDLKPDGGEVSRDWYARLVRQAGERYPGKTHWVDTSKTIEGMQPWLDLVSEGLIASFRVIYLVRDVRGWAAARRARQRRRERSQTPLLSSINTWRRKQQRFLAFLRGNGSDIQSCVVSYESLVFQNRTQLARLTEFLGIAREQSAEEISLGTGTVHDAFGNQVKFDREKRGTLVYDDRWQCQFGVNLLTLCFRPAWRLNAELRALGSVG